MDSATTAPPGNISAQPVRSPDTERWNQLISDCRTRWDKERTVRERNIKLFREGQFPLDGEGKSSSGVSVNLIFLYAKSAMAMLNGNSPNIQVDPRRGENDRSFADVLESWLKYSHQESNTEEADAAVIFWALLGGIAWSKEGFDPESRMDVADALSSLDVAVDPLARYSLTQARWMLQRVVKPVDEARAFFNRNDIEANYQLGDTDGLERNRRLNPTGSSSDKDLYEFFEIWEKAGAKRNLIYFDSKKQAFLDIRDWPFLLDRNEFPFSPLSFNTQYQGVDGFSECDVVAGLRDSMQELMEFDRRHTLRSAAKKILFDKGAWDEDLISKAMDAKDLAPIPVQIPGGRAIAETFTILDLNSSTDFQKEKFERSKQLHDELLGFSELQRGVAQRRKTATESEIEDEWSKSRFQSSLREVDKWKRQQLRHRAQIARQLVSPDEIRLAVGDQAALIWAQYAGDAQDLVREYSISIQAGSMGEHARRKRVEEAQQNLELFNNVNMALQQAGGRAAFDVVELGLEVARARESIRNPERFLLPPPAPPPPQPQVNPMETLGQGQALPPNVMPSAAPPIPVPPAPPMPVPPAPGQMPLPPGVQA